MFGIITKISLKRWLAYSTIFSTALLILLVLSSYLSGSIFRNLIITGSPLIILLERVGLVYLLLSSTPTMLIIAFIYYFAIVSIIFLPMLIVFKHKTRILWSLVLSIIIILLIAYCSVLSAK